MKVLMARMLVLLTLLSALCCSLADNVELKRAKRGTRFFRGEIALLPPRRTLVIIRVHKSPSPTIDTASYCEDSQTSALRSYGDTWLRWKGQRVEYCSCEKWGRERCHFVPVINCEVSMCYNGGTCKKAEYSADYLCQCPPGFTGTQCEIDTNEKCVAGRGVGYRGTWSISHTGAECINWNSTSLRGRKFTAKRPDANSLGLGNHNFCRNPDNDTTPWCYVYKNTQVDWQFCTLPKCAEDKNRECLQGSGQSYRGTTAVTRSGTRCLPWDSPLIRRNNFYNAWKPNALEVGLGSHSFCRNPDGDVAPWCYVYKNFKLNWEQCNIKKCSRRPIIITTLGPLGPLGPRAPTTNNNNRATCGQRLDNSLSRPSFRMFGGQGSDITEQPWQAAINAFSTRNKEHFLLCGGILIDSCWVLSAAHCFEDKNEASQLQVVLGRTFRKQNSSSEQIFEVEKLWLHENFDPDTFDNDIALLKLKSDIGLCAVNSPEVLPACLPEAGLVLPDWTECEISGYGKATEFSAEYSERIKRGFVRLWPQERCVPEVLSGRLVTSNMLCAGDTREKDDACKGDSGGPLVCPKDGKMTLMGVISWGDGCGKKGKPGVYTRVTRYIDWINDKRRAHRDF